MVFHDYFIIMFQPERDVLHFLRLLSLFARFIGRWCRFLTSLVSCSSIVFSSCSRVRCCYLSPFSGSPFFLDSIGSCFHCNCLAVFITGGFNSFRKGVNFLWCCDIVNNSYMSGQCFSKIRPVYCFPNRDGLPTTELSERWHSAFKVEPHPFRKISKYFDLLKFGISKLLILWSFSLVNLKVIEYTVF